MAGYSVDPVLLQEAKAAVDAGVVHYRARAADLDMKRMQLRDEVAFEGGYGMEGHYRDALARFGNAWLAMIDQFVDDEWALATFLEGFSTRLDGTHKFYAEMESRVAGSFEDIDSSSDDDR